MTIRFRHVCSRIFIMNSMFVVSASMAADVARDVVADVSRDVAANMVAYVSAFYWATWLDLISYFVTEFTLKFHHRNAIIFITGVHMIISLQFAK